MTLPPEQLEYPHRRRGMDHDRYAWSPLAARPPAAWPGGARVALVVMPCLQWFPLDMPAGPFPPVGALDEPYPDYRGYSHRDYGNRVGIFRIMAVLDRLAIPATAPINAAVALRYPELVAEVVRRRWEVVAYGLHMGQSHHAGLDRAVEASVIDESLAALRRATGQPARGWLSPGGTESSHTLDLLVERGIGYVLDWANDELPYRLHTASGSVHAMPYAHDLSDATIIWQSHQTTDEFAEAVLDAARALDAEAEQHGGRILPVALHGWIMGQPHRIRALEQLLADLTRRPGVWPATASNVLSAYVGSEERVQ